MTAKKSPLLTFDILTLFPGMFAGPFRESMIRLAKKKGLVKIQVHDLRRFAAQPGNSGPASRDSSDKPRVAARPGSPGPSARDKRRTCDDKPFGGGPGMVMMAQPLFEGIEFLKARRPLAKVILLTPQGKRYTQQDAWQLSGEKEMILVCGHYEEVDERVREHAIDLEYSIGDFITTCGELPAMCLVDSLVRLVPGVVGNKDSIQHESFQNGLLDHPHYTRPRVLRNYAVPDVLLSGDHKKVEAWRKEQAYRRTLERRPDLLKEHKKK